MESPWSRCDLSARSTGAAFMKFGLAPTTKQVVIDTAPRMPEEADRLVCRPYDGPVTELKADVRSYWEADPCGEGLVHAERGSRQYFAEIEGAKDRLEPYVYGFAQFENWRGRDVLEVGCGLGTDTVRFARAGARIVAVDLTDTAVE